MPSFPCGGMAGRQRKHGRVFGAGSRSQRTGSTCVLCTLLATHVLTLSLQFNTCRGSAPPLEAEAASSGRTSGGSCLQCPPHGEERKVCSR